MGRDPASFRSLNIFIFFSLFLLTGATCSVTIVSNDGYEPSNLKQGRVETTVEGGNMEKLIISTTAYSNGFGSDRYKSCAGLTKDERKAVKNDVPVFYLDHRLSNGNSGHYLRVAYYTAWGYKRRLATPDEIAAYIAQTGDDPRYIPQTAETRKQKRAAAKDKYRAAVDAFKIQQAEIANSEIITPRQAGVMDKFGIDGDELNELADDTTLLRKWNGKLMVFESQIGEPAQWRLFQPRPHMSKGCLSHP